MHKGSINLYYTAVFIPLQAPQPEVSSSEQKRLSARIGLFVAKPQFHEQVPKFGKEALGLLIVNSKRLRNDSVISSSMWSYQMKL